MRERMKIWSIIGVVLLLMFVPTVFSGSMGFGPVEITGSNKRDTQIIGTASLINNYEIAKYAVFRLKIPYINEVTWQPLPVEQKYIRVICKDCGEEMERYEAIENYVFPDSPLLGLCETCDSSNLIFYELIPRDEFYCLGLSGAGKFELMEESDFIYVSTEKIPPGETCNIHLLYNASESYVKEYEGRYWEAQLTATLRDEIENEGFGVVAGIGIRLLIEFKFPLFIDVSEVVEKGKEFDVTVRYGDLKNTWREIPEDAHVSFNGETKELNDDGYVTFTAPETRRNFSYELIAEGEKYLPDKITITTGNAVIALSDNEPGFPFLAILFGFFGVMILVFITVLSWIQKKPIRIPKDMESSNKAKPKPWSPLSLMKRSKSLFSEDG
ncbi:MAG: hypothetical protein KAR20_17625, partial [Candidatus Heimdallarchaeota archaeon]|nr:hypothetical protein [Candidatus Heimdallarchaeota archaeon]